jgi:DNA-binding NtrC family response regulator
MSVEKTILVAVDDETVAECVAALIKERGGRAISLARTAEEALTHMERQSVGLVFADLVPQRGMHSSELAVIIADQYPGMPVICASAARDPHRGTTAGCAVIPRPYRSRDIVDAINEVAPGYLAG